MDFPRGELGRLLERPPDDVEKRHDRAADQERDAPAPGVDRRRRHEVGDREAEERREHHRHLLARRLPADVKALVAGRRHLGEIDRHAAELDACGKPLQEPPEHHEHRREHPDRRVGGHEGDQDRAAGHDRQREDQALAAADAVDVRPEHERADRPHGEAGGEAQEGRHQRGVGVLARKEGVRDRSGVDAEQEEVVHLEEVAARDAQNGLELLEAIRGHSLPPTPAPGCAGPSAPPARRDATRIERMRANYAPAKRAAACPAAAPVEKQACSR